MILTQSDMMNQLQPSTPIQVHIQTLRASLRVWHVTALAMIATGLLYPAYSQFTIPTILMDMLTYWGFIAWCSSLVVAGIGMIVRPKYMLLWLSSLLVFLLAATIYAWHGFFLHVGLHHLVYGKAPSYTAIIYYGSLYLLTLKFFYQEQYQDQSLKLFALFPPLRVAGMINLLMALVLIIHPDGAGMGLLYVKFEQFTLGVIPPATGYQIIYLASGFILVLFPVVNRLTAQTATGAMILHGFLFSVHIAFNSFAWSFVPFFIAVSALWFYLGGRGYE